MPMPSTPRTAQGRFVPGHSGNPAGRPATQATLRDAARLYSLAALEVVAQVLHDSTTPLRTRFIAARTLLQAAGPEPARESRMQKRQRRLSKTLQEQSRQVMQRFLITSASSKI